jgi:hypothetical protein
LHPRMNTTKISAPIWRPKSKVGQGSIHAGNEELKSHNPNRTKERVGRRRLIGQTIEYGETSTSTRQEQQSEEWHTKKQTTKDILQPSTCKI